MQPSLPSHAVDRSTDGQVRLTADNNLGSTMHGSILVVSIDAVVVLYVTKLAQGLWDRLNGFEAESE